MSESDRDDSNQGYSSLLQYSGMALEFFVICGIGAFVGSKLDKWLRLCFPAFTILLLLCGMAAALWIIYRQTIIKEK